MSTRARLARDSAGITELEELVPVSVHLVKAGANGFRPLAAKAKGCGSSLASACAAVGVALPARTRRKGSTARLTEGP
jgi:hypothetical protein